MELVQHILRLCGCHHIGIIGIGNTDRADDGFGIKVAESLKQLFPNRVFSESEGIDEIIRICRGRVDIDCVLFIDTIDKNTHPGKVEIIEKENLGEISSSHKFPIKLYCTLVEKPCFLIGIQPKNIGFSEPVSKEVQQGINKVVKILERILRSTS